MPSVTDKDNASVLRPIPRTGTVETSRVDAVHPPTGLRPRGILRETSRLFNNAVWD